MTYVLSLLQNDEKQDLHFHLFMVGFLQKIQKDTPYVALVIVTLNVTLHFDRPCHNSGLILGLFLANERRRYFVTTSLIGWVQA